MKTSATETQQIEAYLLGGNAEDALLVEARLLIDENLRTKTAWQQKTYELVNAYGRKKLKQEIEAVHHELFTSQKYLSFKEKILGYFRV